MISSQGIMAQGKPSRSRFRYASKEIALAGVWARDGSRGPVRRPPARESAAEDSVELTESWVIDDLGPMSTVITGDVERAICDRDFAMRMKAARLARARRAPDWAEQWLALEDEYDARCQLAQSLLGDGIEDVALHDGHVAELVLTARALVDRGRELFAKAPCIFHVHVTNYAGVGRSLFSSPWLRGIQSLGLRAQALEDEDVETLVQSPHIEGLRWLDLSHNKLSARSFELLAACPALVHLEYLGLDGNAAESPVDQIGTDPIDGAVVYTARTAAGRALEEQVGELKWLHAPARFPYSYPPTPLDVAKTP